MVQGLKCRINCDHAVKRISTFVFNDPLSHGGFSYLQGALLAHPPNDHAMSVECFWPL